MPLHGTYSRDFSDNALMPKNSLVCYRMTDGIMKNISHKLFKVQSKEKFLHSVQLYVLFNHGGLFVHRS